MPIPKPNKDEKKKDFIARCMGDSVMTKEYEQSQRGAVCNLAWEKKTANCQTINNSVSGYTAKPLVFEGRKHLVVPVVMMVEGVHLGSGGPIFYSKETLENSIGLWNGFAVAINHPEDSDGNMISCNQPEVVDKQVTGRLYNTRMEDNRLKADLYLDEERLKTLNNNLYQKIKKGEVIEVSTGIVPISLGNGGTWNGENYESEALEFRPDHLAILPNDVGACSIKDGCGIRNNKGGQNVVKETKDELINRLCNNQDQSIRDRLNKVYDLLFAKDNDMVKYNLVDLFDKYIIYEVYPGPMANKDSVSHLFKVSYSVNKDVITLGDSPEEVKKETKYVSVNNTTKKEVVNKMSDETKRKVIDNLIACSCTKWQEKDREILNKLDENVLSNMEVAIPDDKILVDKKEKEMTEDEKKKKEEEEKAKKTTANKAPTMNEFLNTIPDEYKELVTNGLKMQADKRKELVTNILAADGNKFTDKQLEKMSLEQLEGITALISNKKVEDESDDNPTFLGNGGVVDNAKPNDNDEPLPIPSWEDYKTNKK